MANDQDSIKLIKALLEQHKPVATVCHAPGVLLNVTTADGEPLVKDKKITGFSNSEEAAVELTKVVPFLIEDKAQELGGDYLKGEDWQSYVLVDGLLITGQNPGSSESVADALLTMLKS